MTSSQGGSKGQQVNNCLKAKDQGDVNRFANIEPGSQGHNESRTSRADEYVQGGGNLVAVDKNAPPQEPPHQLQDSLVHWERFLHVRSIKVMLVEDDDCTRHIVTALLRNCNYEVIEAANGIQAWKILENLSNHIDIVLTEVAMPCLSGIGLLCKIMSHKTRKNIPVIMMSSHDSMGLVFKCLSKGAIDFLVKPIRKNELKILWQHVWRRCQSSSGSGSESGTQAQKSVNSKSNLRYHNNGSSNEKAKEIAICKSKDNILRHSELSAFTRYKSKGTPGITASCSPPEKSKRDVQSDGVMPPGNVEHHIHHHHHHVHHYHNIDTTEQPLSNHDVTHSGSSHSMGGSGSKHGSSNVNFEVAKVENDADKSGNTINYNVSGKRKIALTKFRQKRELRCFHKKVRYQNRKRLAEERPRARGQFVKGTSSTNAADG